MAKKKAATKEEIAEQIKVLIDAGDFEGAQKLIASRVNKKAIVKKSGRLPKQRAKTRKEEAPPTPSSPANNSPSNGVASCIAPSKRVDSSPESRKIEKDGKIYTASMKVAWAPPKKIVFKEDKSIERNPELKYPPRATPRKPAEQQQYICYKCDRKVMLYPGQGPDSEMLYTCDYCMKNSRR